MATIHIDEHVLLRPYEAGEAEELFAVINANRQHMGAWLGWVAGTTRPEHSLEFIEQSRRQIHEQQALSLGIFYDGRIIGGAGMYDWQQDIKLAQLGYWIARDYEGQGIVRRSVAGLVSYLFDVAGLNKMEIRYAPANKRSGYVAERLGFRVEGVLRQSSLRNGMPEDLVVTGLLRSEWRMRHQAQAG